MNFLNNQLLLFTVLVICCCDVILSAPQYTNEDNNEQRLTGNEEGTTEIIQEEIIPVNSPVLAPNATFVPVSPLLYRPPFLPYNSYNPSFFYQPYYIPRPILPTIPSGNIPIQPSQPPTEAKNIYLDYDENNNLISNSTTGFQPITNDEINRNSNSNGIQERESRFKQTTNNQTYVTPLKSIKKQEYRTSNQESYIVAETYIRPNEKPKTIIRVYYDPSQKRENITIEDPESNKVIEIESNVVNGHVVTNNENDGVVNNPTDGNSNDSFGDQQTTTEYFAWPFSGFVPTEAQTKQPELLTDEIVTPVETTSEETSPEPAIQTADGSLEDATTQTANDDSVEDDENEEEADEDDEEEDEENQKDDYNAIIPQTLLKKKINDKMYEQIPKKWLNLPTTEQVIPTTTTETVPIWLRKSNTTPKMFAFNNLITPTSPGKIVENIRPKSSNSYFGWLSQKQPTYNPTSWNVETTTKGLRFVFFR